MWVIESLTGRLRHTWATWHYAANRDLVALMELGGWKSERMVLRYAHMNVAHREQSLAALPWEKSDDSKKRPRDRLVNSMTSLSTQRSL